MPDEDGQRNAELIKLEAQARTAIRDAVNRKSRKPFHWGGLKGYDQLSSIGEALNKVPTEEAGTNYLRRLVERVNCILDRYRVKTPLKKGDF